MHLARVEALGAYMHSSELIAALENQSEESLAFISQAVADIVKRQLETGLKFVTDGELRLKKWDYDFYFGFNNVERVLVDTGRVYQEVETGTDIIRLGGRIEFNPEHPVIANFRSLKELVGDSATPRQSMPSPALMFIHLLRDKMQYEAVYDNVDVMADDIIAAYRKTIQALYEQGCRSVKFDDPTWGYLFDDVYLRRFIQGGFDVVNICKLLVRINQEILLDMPEDLQKIMHVCRHSHNSVWTPAPDYSEFSQFAFDNPDADAFMIDCGFDTDFAYLANIRKDAEVALGLSDPWSPQLVEPEQIEEAVRKASEFMPLQRLSISPRAGFCSKPDNLNAFEPEDQWRKLERLLSIAPQIWPADFPIPDNTEQPQ